MLNVCILLPMKLSLESITASSISVQQQGWETLEESFADLPPFLGDAAGSLAKSNSVAMGTGGAVGRGTGKDVGGGTGTDVGGGLDAMFGG